MQTATMHENTVHLPVVDSRVGKYLSFYVGPEEFAIAVLGVREIMGMQDITAVPHTPVYVKGIINLRGKVVPVVDLRLKFGMTIAEKTVNTCVIIVEVEMEGEKVVMGAMADAVQEVLDLEPDQIEPPPRIGTKLNTDFIRGMGKHADQFIIILDIDKVFTIDELELVHEPNLVATNG